MKLLPFVCKLNREIYRVVTEDIVTDEVIITDKQIEHIKERHPGDFERFATYMKDTIEFPDYILSSNKPFTAMVLKEIEIDGRKLRLILRLKTSTDPADYKNSIITFQHVRDKEWRRMLNNGNIIYKRAV